MPIPLAISGDYAPSVRSCGFDRATAAGSVVVFGRGRGCVPTPAWRILLVSAGSLRRLPSGRTVHEGSVLLLPPGWAGSWRMAPGTRLEHLLFTVRGRDRRAPDSADGRAPIARQPDASATWGVAMPERLLDREREAAIALWHRVRALYWRSPADRLRADAVLAAFLAELVAARWPRPPGTDGAAPDEDPVRVAEAQVRRYHARGETIRCADLAGAAGVSASTFRVRFRAHEGIPPRAWIQRERHKRAQELLADGWSVAEAARRLGYAGASAFCRAFRASHGVSPAAWRQQAQAPKVITARPAGERQAEPRPGLRPAP